MPVIQSVYNSAPAIGYPGMVANGETSNRISRIVESAAGIAFGQPAWSGSDDKGATVGGTFAATAVGAADAGNTGAGAISAAPVVAAGAKPGAYKVVQVTGGATGAFNVFDPDGLFVGNGAVGTEFVGGGLTFTVADPGTDPAIGDSYTVTVTYTANRGLLGIVIADHGQHVVPGGVAADIVPRYHAAGIMNAGAIWVTAGATVAPRQQVYWNPATSRFTNTATHIRLDGWDFDSSAVDEGIVRIVRR